MSASVIFDYLTQMNNRQASDLYLTVGFPPALRIDNQIHPIAGSQPLVAEDVKTIAEALLTSRQLADFEKILELNTSLDLGKHGRFRINMLRQRQFTALVIRRIVSKIPSFDVLRLPRVLEKISLLKRGLVVVTGMTGAGKSTTLAAMIDYRNANEAGHIITIEDPIEFFHDHKKCLVSQREIGVDTESYSLALKNALRQRPDVILVGEIREREVMSQTIMAAETGHLCLSTLHSSNAYQALERILNFYPEDARAQLRLSLALNLRAIISQRLVPSLDGGLTAAVEIMINEGHVKDLIHEGHTGKIREVMEQNSTAGMCTFDQSLLGLYRDRIISEDTAVSHADIPGDLKVKIQQFKLANDQSALKKMDISRLSINE